MKACERCKTPFECKADKPAEKCWCTDLPPINVPKTFGDCLCEKCLREVGTAPENLVQGEDYYFDDKGLMVFTANYHLKRGTCCDNGCRHCPF
ncbi:MAG: cysteine-rich CWC family protein [Bdellovibrionia bacterium]